MYWPKSAAFILLAGALLWVSCSRPAVKPPAPGMTLRLAYASNPDSGLVHLALARGFFAAEGLSVTAQPFPFGKLALAALTRGEAELATVAETPLVFAILGGEKLRIAAVIGTSDDNTAIAASKRAGISSGEDLAGKAIGVTKGTTGEYFLSCFLLAQGIDEKRVRIIDMQPEAMLAALESGRVAAVCTWNPTLRLIAAALGHGGQVLYGEGLYTESFCLAGSEAFIAKNPVAMKAFLRALSRAESYIREHPEETLASIAVLLKTDIPSLRADHELFRFRLSLDQALLLTLEDESRWAMKARLAAMQSMPDYLGYLSSDALAAVAPERVRLIR